MQVTVMTRNLIKESDLVGISGFGANDRSRISGLNFEES